MTRLTKEELEWLRYGMEWLGEGLEHWSASGHVVPELALYLADQLDDKLNEYGMEVRK